MIVGCLMKDLKTICLKTYAKQGGSHHVALELHERLPQRISGPCALACDFEIEDHTDYYVLKLSVSGLLTMICQRCIHEFKHAYSHETQLAVCKNDELAETLMESFECTVNQTGEIDLVEVLTDDLHLFSPEKHLDVIECDADISQWIGAAEA